MNKKTFLIFVGPSIVMMVLFIAFPLITVLKQSFHVTKPVYNVVEQKTCTPGFLKPVCKIEMVNTPVYNDKGKPKTITTYVGWDNYKNVLEVDRFVAAVSHWSWEEIMSIRFWSALRFTLSITIVTLPIILLLGLAVALATNATVKSIRGPIIFISLLPFVITPVIGALSIRWLFIGDGILTSLLEWIFDKDISMFSQAWTIELLMYFYRIWNIVPFAFIVLYAGLQSVNSDTIESAIIDGANVWQKLIYVIIPHLMPLVIFIAVISLMDSYRVFEEIIGFSSESYVISLQWLTFDYLNPDQSGNRAISRASANSMLTMLGIVLLLIYPLYQTWTEHKNK